MTDWITDRPPTEADGDEDGDVVVRHDGLVEGAILQPWKALLPETHWRHTPIWKPQPHPEPVDAEFTPPAAEIPGPIRSGVAPFYVVVASDDSGGGSGGKPISWETQIPEGSSLQAALQQQARIGSRYGTTFIAECRIIPELTRDV